jgi:CRP-like cAMP-binding protein
MTQTLSIDAADRLAKRLVANHPFPGASHTGLERVMGQGIVRHLSAWEVLCEEGDPGDEMWFLLRGSIEIQRKDLSGELKQLGVIHAPALIGHMALVDRSPRSATCVAQTDVEIVVVGSAVYDRLLSEATISGSSLRRLLLSSLSGQLTAANAQIRQLVDDLTEEQAPAVPVKASRRAPAPKRKRRTTEARVASVSAKLGGWDADLEEMAADVEVVFDEDQIRTRDYKRGR